MRAVYTFTGQAIFTLPEKHKILVEESINMNYLNSKIIPHNKIVRSIHSHALKAIHRNVAVNMAVSVMDDGSFRFKVVEND